MLTLFMFTKFQKYPAIYHENWYHSNTGAGMEEIETFWTEQQKQILAYHGISMSDVHTVASNNGCDGMVMGW